MATENLMMAGVAAGGDRQTLHERLRSHSLAVQQTMKAGGPNDLLPRLREDPAFGQVDFGRVMEPRSFVGRAPEQVTEFLREEIAPLRARLSSGQGTEAEVSV
jgi:adenylosuccinate lyase